MSYDLWPLFHAALPPLPSAILRIRPVALLIALHQYFLGSGPAAPSMPPPPTVAHIFQLSKLADVQNLHICCFRFWPARGDPVPLCLSLVSRFPFLGLSLSMPGICLPFRFGTICHWQAVILWLVSWVCLPVCPASLWTPTSARVDFKGSLWARVFGSPRRRRCLSVSVPVAESHL